jgi:hydrogenase expression/formation protein HypC
MCLGVPMQVTSIDGFTARCTARGVEREVSLFLLQEEGVVAGDYVLVHVGYAIQKVSERDARSSWELFDQILAQGGDGLASPSG